MSRRPIIAGNWKLHHGPAAARALATALVDSVGTTAQADVVLFPTALSIAAVVDVVHASDIAVGVQWTHHAASGAYTGTNSPQIAREAGCHWALAGHSEVRRDLGASDADVHASVVQALAAGLLPMICIGESLAQREAGDVDAVIERQLQGAFGDMHADQVATCTLAYEPIWAIGTGVTASPDQAQEAHAIVRAWLRSRYPAFVADAMRVLYGGSVKPNNAADLLAKPDIDGALVGGASLDAASFEAIVRAV